VVELGGGIRREVLSRAAQRAGSVNGCGSAGAKSTRTWTTGLQGAPRETAVVVLERAAAE
jgi:hypothetical protein